MLESFGFAIAASAFIPERFSNAFMSLIATGTVAYLGYACITLS